MKLNEKIYTLRKRLGCSQEELGEKLGVSRQTVSKWEIGVMNPETEKIVIMSKLFNVPTDTLLIDEIAIPNCVENINVANTEEMDQTKPVSKKRGKDSLLAGIILLTVSLIGIISIILISLFSKSAGDVTVIYTTMYITLKTIFIILTVLLAVGISIITYKLIKRHNRKGKDN